MHRHFYELAFACAVGHRLGPGETLALPFIPPNNRLIICVCVSQAAAWYRFAPDVAYGLVTSVSFTKSARNDAVWLPIVRRRSRDLLSANSSSFRIATSVRFQQSISGDSGEETKTSDRNRPPSPAWSTSPSLPAKEPLRNSTSARIYISSTVEQMNGPAKSDDLPDMLVQRADIDAGIDDPCVAC